MSHSIPHFAFRRIALPALWQACVTSMAGMMFASVRYAEPALAAYVVRYCSMNSTQTRTLAEPPSR
jgi:hypothetical protein